MRGRLQIAEKNGLEGPYIPKQIICDGLHTTIVADSTRWTQNTENVENGIRHTKMSYMTSI